ncbi:MAG: 30S ribosomal protein S5 [Candidatus Komeilibacteria bacterium CG_4_10_14_0_2_um_filter_37_10]|uniref:Small ribosomal subunit protein uS5 n=1 Tax=Candidatus Komeilibacteria bacterium CG_4_10_14_0_2_um_filter_37_10 TaxID=1974470 RepID=A0A2M7VG01_9BACT|nr:MAG: 30S ribosomal protein S5 [Candidatus Komeilibacteria bacterium CG_4_10_14_0_2_um_filter_37_10]
MVDKPTKKRFTKRPDRERDDFDQRIVDLARVTRVMAGGKRMRFRACVVIGDHRGNIGFGLAKGADVTLAVAKAAAHARKRLIKINIIEGTIPHQVLVKYKAAKVLLRPAPGGTGIIAGGAVRMVLELSGINNISSKIFGTNNKINNVKATFKALEILKNRPEHKTETKKEVEKNINNKE